MRDLDKSPVRRDTGSAPGGHTYCTQHMNIHFRLWRRSTWVLIGWLLVATPLLALWYLSQPTSTCESDACFGAALSSLLNRILAVALWVLGTVIVVLVWLVIKLKARRHVGTGTAL